MSTLGVSIINGTNKKIRKHFLFVFDTFPLQTYRNNHDITYNEQFNKTNIDTV